MVLTGEVCSKCFPSTLRRRNLKTQQSPVIWIICVSGKLGQGNHMIIARDYIVVETSPFSKCFASTQKRKAGVFKFLRFAERLRKAPISWRISVEGRPNQRNKAAFSNFSDVALTGPLKTCIAYAKVPLQNLSLTIACRVIWIAELSQIKLFYSPDVWCEQQNCLPTAGVDQ